MFSFSHYICQRLSITLYFAKPSVSSRDNCRFALQSLFLFFYSFIPFQLGLLSFFLLASFVKSLTFIFNFTIIWCVFKMINVLLTTDVAEFLQILIWAILILDHFQRLCHHHFDFLCNQGMQNFGELLFISWFLIKCIMVSERGCMKLSIFGICRISLVVNLAAVLYKFNVFHLFLWE